MFKFFQNTIHSGFSKEFIFKLYQCLIFLKFVMVVYARKIMMQETG